MDRQAFGISPKTDICDHDRHRQQQHDQTCVLHHSGGFPSERGFVQKHGIQEKNAPGTNFVTRFSWFSTFFREIRRGYDQLP
jgi:hypothetical protein